MSMMIKRDIENAIRKVLKQGKSILLLGARQTGKTTLVKLLQPDLYLTLTDIRLRQAYETNPGIFIGEIEALSETITKPLVVIDEIQKVPELMDGIQYLIDENIAQFIITGSSARKISNFLPGRVVNFQLDPLSLSELSDINPTLEDRLNYGVLPEIITAITISKKTSLLKNYTENFIEEEIRKEAVVRGIGSFRRFLELAAIESGNQLNLSKISSDVGVAHTTISSYYSILEECKIAERFEPFLYKNTRRRLSKSQKFILFDLGVRRLASKENIRTSDVDLGRLFEQYIGLELKKLATFSSNPIQIKFWRDTAGAEIDWIIEKPDSIIPVEVKWTTSPDKKDARHIISLMKEVPQIKKGFIICRVTRPVKLSSTITAISWDKLKGLI